MRLLKKLNESPVINCLSWFAIRFIFTENEVFEILDAL